MSVLSQIFNATQNVWILLGFVKNLFFEPNFQYCQSTTQNFWILPNFIVGMSRVVKTLNFGLNFYCDWKFLNFTNFHLSHVLNGQKCQFWAKFLTRIKISSLAGQGWSNSWFQVKFTTRLKISEKYQNFFISPNFILLGSRVVKILNFEPNFQHHSKFLDFAKFHLSWVQSGQKCQFWAKFSTWLKMSAFCQLSAFPGPEWSKMSILIQILTGTKNFRILPNFIIGRSGVIKNLIFEPYFLDKSKFFWIMSNFILCCFGVDKTLIFEPNFQCDWKFLDLAKFSPLHVPCVQNSQILCQIFKVTKNFWILPNFILCMSWVVKNVTQHK